MDDKEFKDIAMLLAVLGLAASGEIVERIPESVMKITEELMVLRQGAHDQGIVGIRKRRTK